MGVNPWSLGEVSTMGAGLASSWDYHETIEDLKHKLVSTNMELDELRVKAHDELHKGKENIKQLIELVGVRTFERDAARIQLQLLLNQFKQPNMAHLPPYPNIMESDHNHRSHVSSPVESFVDAVDSPELSSINMGESWKTMSCSSIPRYDEASAVTDNLAMKKPLPERGKFLQAVLQAGPLLQTLMLAGPLPQWRNPPPLRQLQLPSLEIRAYNAPALKQTTFLNPGPLAHSTHIYAVPVLSFPGSGAL